MDFFRINDIDESKKEAMMAKDNEYTVLVDNTASRENVTRYAEHQGYTVSVSEADGVYTLICRK